MLYFFIIEHLWTDMPIMPGIESSSSTLTFISNRLSRPETKDACILLAFKFEILLCVILLMRFKFDFLAFAQSKLDALLSKLGFYWGLGGQKEFVLLASFIGEPFILVVGLPLWFSKDQRLSPSCIEPGEKRCIVATFKALILIFLDTSRSSSYSLRSVSSARSNSFLSAISSSPRSSLAAIAASAAACSSITFC